MNHHSYTTPLFIPRRGTILPPFGRASLSGPHRWLGPLARIGAAAVATSMAILGVFFISSPSLLISFTKPPSSATISRSLPAAEERTEAQKTIPSEPAPQDGGAVELPLAGAPNAKLTIEKIGVNIPIVEGKDEKVLFSGAWRSPWSNTPDQGGNTVLFGHRYYRRAPHPETFYSLDKISVGDAFEVMWNGARYHYRVAEVKIVPPNDLSVLRHTERPTVTLITCTPVFTTKERLVVKGELVAKETPIAHAENSSRAAMVY